MWLPILAALFSRSLRTMSNAKLWGGRFSESTSEAVEAFSESVSFDARLWKHDIAGSKAHARMLGRVGVLPAADVDAICAGLDAIAGDIEAGRFEWRTALEDVHMNIEQALTERIGDAGKRLHTGRSRNDQIATDVRLYVRDAIDGLVADLDARPPHLRQTPRHYRHGPDRPGRRPPGQGVRIADSLP